jgi:hypothetical protein
MNRGLRYLGWILAGGILFGLAADIASIEQPVRAIIWCIGAVLGLVMARADERSRRAGKDRTMNASD